MPSPRAGPRVHVVHLGASAETPTGISENDHAMHVEGVRYITPLPRMRTRDSCRCCRHLRRRRHKTTPGVARIACCATSRAVLPGYDRLERRLPDQAAVRRSGFDHDRMTAGAV
jgi:hypothetical protein